MSDKQELLTIDKLQMSEVRTFEKMAGCTIRELYQREGEDMPAAVIMTLAYLTDKRANPSVSRDSYESLTYTQLVELLEERFTFETPDDEEGDDGNPTGAA